MFGENLKIIRSKKGLSQQDVAERLHVVRQTVSKWEKGLSVPDAHLLIRLAQVLDTSVSVLLGDTISEESDEKAIGRQLEQLNFELAEKNRRSRRIWRVVAAVLIVIVAIVAVLVAINVMTPVPG